MRKIKKYLLTAFTCCGVASETFAQQLEEIVVTAQKRVESLQDVSISVTAVTGEAMLNGGFSDVEDLSTFVPNLYINDGFSGQRMTIRGIGTAVGNEAFEQAVAQFHDGIYYGRDDLSRNSVYDVERIEVVRGPQPTFAGQSATAGAINTISRKPGDTFEANALGAYGSDKESNLEFGIGGPLTDSFALRASGRYYELDDTGYTQIGTGDTLGYKENKGARLIGVWTPTDALSLEFKYEYQDVNQVGNPRAFIRCDTDRATSVAGAPFLQGFGASCAMQSLYYGLPIGNKFGRVGEGGFVDVWDAAAAIDAANGLNPGDPGAWTPAPGTSNVVQNADEIAQFREPLGRAHEADIGKIGIDWAIGDLTLSAVTGWLAYDKYHVLDPDHTTFAIFRAGREETFEQTSQEIRLTSSDDQTLSWMVGLYWQEHEIDSHLPVYTVFETPLGAAAGFAGDLHEESSWKSVFFASTYNISDTWRLNVGGRYQKVEKDGLLTATYAPLNEAGTAFEDFRLYPPIPQFARASQAHALEHEADDVLPEIGLEWDATADIMLYAKYSEAFKAGGFVVGPSPGGGIPDRLTYDPEFAEGFELGLKSILFDGTVRLNVAIYDADYTDLQVTQQDEQTSNFETVNAAGANTKGIEFDGQWGVTDRFTLGFAGAISDAHFTDYKNADGCNSLTDKLWEINNPDAGDCVVDLSGAPLQNTPDFTLSLSPEYQFDLVSNLLGTFSANILFSDGYPLGLEEDPDNYQDAFRRVDLRFAIEPESGNWTVALYGRNVTDAKICLSCDSVDQANKTTRLDYDGLGVALDRGARYGVQLIYRFGQ